MRVAKPTPHRGRAAFELNTLEPLSRVERAKETSSTSLSASPAESRGLSFRGTSPSLLARHCNRFKKFRLVEEWVPAFAGMRGKISEAGERSLTSNREK
jgi:hypothetical protein